MDLQAEILREHSRAQSEKIAKWIGTDKKRFAEFMRLFLKGEYRVTQRTAWVLSMIAERHYQMVEPYLEVMVKRMNEPGIHVAVKRNVVRILQFLEIPEALHSEVMNTCFELLADPKETIAVRVFSMTVLANLSKLYPDIKYELRAIIEDQLAHEPSAGFKNRAQKVLAMLK